MTSIDHDGVRRASVPNAVDKSTVIEAAAAGEAERELGILASFKLYRKACMWSVFLSTAIVMEGFDMTLINNLYAYPPFQRKFGAEQPDGSYQLTAAWQAGLSNGALTGQILGLFLNGIVAERYGYRKTIIGALTACVAFIFIIFFAESLPMLLAGEVLIGFPWGVFQTLAPTYAAEVCPVHLRAYLTTYVNLCWVMGQFLASAVLKSMLSRDDKWGYKIPFALQWIWPVPIAIGVFLAPESPWWLVRKGRLEDAKRSLIRLTDRHSLSNFKPDETISMMVHTNEMEKEETSGTSYSDLFKGVNLRRTEIVCAAWMVQSWCGASLIGYSTYFYQNAGLATSASFSMSLAQYGIGAIGTIISWFLITKFGRRTLYFSGECIMIVFLLAIACASFAGENNVPSQWAIGSMLLIFAFTYQSTVGPVCYSLVSEMTSTRLRTKSVVMARNCYNISNLITNAFTPNMLNPTAWNWGAKTAFFWAGTCFVCAIWTYFRLPEPKGRTFAELDILFEQRVSARKFASTVVDRVDEGVAMEKDMVHGQTAVQVEHAGVHTKE
ncbi:Maltose permease-like protein [Emericellopsis cladophorae]|uniref:Maltose permease-like protein n=1 Tax=Emericellopsis cladophorae TaxID=2686198 RepID=A0A9P9XWU3_9HYPO|nr:Maltose permease-like protein [Emericellopsis cladophorae]KAI6779013.1 Maltose permease-like protein [Emericellopsis cladophorae]